MFYIKEMKVAIILKRERETYFTKRKKKKSFCRFSTKKLFLSFFLNQCSIKSIFWQIMFWHFISIQPIISNSNDHLRFAKFCSLYQVYCSASNMFMPHNCRKINISISFPLCFDITDFWKNYSLYDIINYHC
jgi:hypothetical protein